MSRYSADLTAGSLKIAETRTVAALLLNGASPEEMRHALTNQNVLQAKSPATAVRLGRLIQKRLLPWDRLLWEMIRDGSTVLATQAALAAAIKHSALLGDFLDLVVREQYRIFAPCLNVIEWDKYLENCRSRDFAMPVWNASTQRRLRSTVFQILAQAGYICNTRTTKLQSVILEPQLIQFLENRKEDYVLRCLRVCP